MARHVVADARHELQQVAQRARARALIGHFAAQRVERALQLVGGQVSAEQAQHRHGARLHLDQPGGTRRAPHQQPQQHARHPPKHTRQRGAVSVLLHGGAQYVQRQQHLLPLARALFSSSSSESGCVRRANSAMSDEATTLCTLRARAYSSSLSLEGKFIALFDAIV